MPCPWPREVASTVAEHMNLATRDHVSTHVPGRIEGSREHTNLAIASERNNRLGLTSASSRGEPRARDSHARRQTRSPPRPPPRRSASHVRATHTHEGRRDQCLGRRCRRGANHEVPRRAPPLGPAGRFAWTSKRSLDPTTMDAMRGARDGSTSCKFSSASGVGTVLDRSNSSSRQLAPGGLVFSGGYKGGSDPMKTARRALSRRRPRAHDDGCHAPGRVRSRARSPST
jgi:hypothetical protein